MAERGELAGEVMRKRCLSARRGALPMKSDIADTGLHANQAGRHVGEPHLNLAARPFLAMPTTTICTLAVLGMSGSCWCSPSRCQRHSLAGQEHGRTIPLPDSGSHDHCDATFGS